MSMLRHLLAAVACVAALLGASAVAQAAPGRPDLCDDFDDGEDAASADMTPAPTVTVVAAAAATPTPTPYEAWLCFGGWRGDDGLCYGPDPYTPSPGQNVVPDHAARDAALAPARPALTRAVRRLAAVRVTLGAPDPGFARRLERPPRSSANRPS